MDPPVTLQFLRPREASTAILARVRPHPSMHRLVRPPQVRRAKPLLAVRARKGPLPAVRPPVVLQLRYPAERPVAFGAGVGLVGAPVVTGLVRFDVSEHVGLRGETFGAVRTIIARSLGVFLSCAMLEPRADMREVRRYRIGFLDNNLLSWNLLAGQVVLGSYFFPDN